MKGNSSHRGANVEDKKGKYKCGSRKSRMLRKLGIRVIREGYRAGAVTPRLPRAALGMQANATRGTGCPDKVDTRPGAGVKVHVCEGS